MPCLSQDLTRLPSIRLTTHATPAAAHARTISWLWLFLDAPLAHRITPSACNLLRVSPFVALHASTLPKPRLVLNLRPLHPRAVANWRLVASLVRASRVRQNANHSPSGIYERNVH